MGGKRYTKLYSFLDAYNEAIKNDPIKSQPDYNRKTDMNYLRREFRAFLESLQIEPRHMKKARDILPLGFGDPYEWDDTIEWNAAIKWNETVKRAPFYFSENALNFIIDYIKNWKSFKYKEMRRGHFSKEYASDYRTIITAVEFNMHALGYAQEEIAHQVCDFWMNIVSKSTQNVLDFLDIGNLLCLNEHEKETIAPTTYLEKEDYIFESIANL